MTRTRIKICGVTRVDDALDAAALGADAVGMILHADSDRRIDIDSAREIVTSLPPFVTPVGVFVDASVEHIVETADALGLTTVQLHGGEKPKDAGKLSPLRVIKMTPSTKPAKAWLRGELPRNVTGLLFDTGAGSGVENDWSAVRATWLDAEPHRNGVKLHVAGGLTPRNVADAIRITRPWAVDVSTGVEESRGVKSAAKMMAFCRAVRLADSG